MADFKVVFKHNSVWTEEVHEISQGGQPVSISKFILPDRLDMRQEY